LILASDIKFYFDDILTAYGRTGIIFTATSLISAISRFWSQRYLSEECSYL